MSDLSPFWASIEKIHHGVYFAPDTRGRYEAVGLKGYWMGYMASRSAALGTPSPELVVATFHGFAPALVNRAIPAAWERASREDVLRVRMEIVRDLLAEPLAPLDAGAVASLAAGLVEVVEGLDIAGRPLAAAHLALPRPGDDVGLLWWADTVIREYRGDSHLAVLVAAGLDGCESNALAVAAGLALPDQRELRGWTEDEWSAALGRLAERGWVEADGTLTAGGRDARAGLEDHTDRVCLAGMSAGAVAQAKELIPALAPVSDAFAF